MSAQGQVKDQLGWMWLDGANSWHWMKEDHRSLCGRWACFTPLLGERRAHDSPDNCKTCAKRLVRRAR